MLVSKNSIRVICTNFNVLVNKNVGYLKWTKMKISSEVNVVVSDLCVEKFFSVTEITWNNPKRLGFILTPRVQRVLAFFRLTYTRQIYDWAYEPRSKDLRNIICHCFHTRKKTLSRTRGIFFFALSSYFVRHSC